MPTAAALLVCGYAPSSQYTLAEVVVTLQARVFEVILTQTKIGHGACINHNI